MGDRLVMRRMVVFVIATCVTAVGAARADDTIYRYEGNVHPLDPTAGWLQGNTCDLGCKESVENGRFVIRWARGGDTVNYGLRIGTPEAPAPSALWVEWQFRSNHPLGPNFFTCDGGFSVDFAGVNEVVLMYGDTAISFSGDFFVPNLPNEEFQTYRFESTDGINFRISVNGRVFVSGMEENFDEYSSLGLQGRGGCDGMPNTVNEWDFVRYGTISFGEKVIDSDPPQGLVDAREPLDRFTVTFDSANYVYIDDILVETTGDESPVILMTRRRENDEPDTVEIVLDRPIAFGETTRFTMTDAGPPPIDGVNTIEYHFATGDFDNSGSVALTDHAQLANCLKGPTRQSISRACTAFDFTADKAIDLWDFAFFQTVFTGETP